MSEVVRRLLAKRSHRCPVCEYDMRATPGTTCPECGTRLTPVHFAHPDLRPGAVKRAFFFAGLWFVLGPCCVATLLLLSVGFLGSALLSMLLTLEVFVLTVLAVFWPRVIWDRRGVALWAVLIGAGLAMAAFVTAFAVDLPARGF